MKNFSVEGSGTALQELHPWAAAGSRTQPGPATATGTSWRAAPTWASLLCPSALLQKGNNICFVCSPLRKPWGFDPRHPETQNILPLQILCSTCCQRQGGKQHSIFFFSKKQEKWASLCPAKGFLSWEEELAFLCLTLPLTELQILGRQSYISGERTNTNVGGFLTNNNSFTFPGMLIVPQWKMQAWTV